MPPDIVHHVGRTLSERGEHRKAFTALTVDADGGLEQSAEILEEVVKGAIDSERERLVYWSFAPRLRCSTPRPESRQEDALDRHHEAVETTT